MKKTITYDTARDVLTTKYTLFGLTLYVMEVSAPAIRYALVAAPSA